MSSTIGRVRLLGGILRRIGDFNLSEFSERLRFQKTVYFLQVFGIYLGYRFSWYVYGPYSPDLARDGFQWKPIRDQIPPIAFSNAETEKKFDDLLSFLGEHKKISRNLELLASIHFLSRLDPKFSKEDIIDRVKAKQWYFNEPVARKAWDYLGKFGLI